MLLVLALPLTTAHCPARAIKCSAHTGAVRQLAVHMAGVQLQLQAS